MSRLLAEMMPSETEPPSPNGLPIAITQSPTSISAEEPNFTSGSGFFGVTFKSARSALVSRPMILSTTSLEPSWKLMSISSAPSMTWLLVTISPSLPSITKPEPKEEILRSPCGTPPRLLKKSSKKSSNGAPFGTFGNGTPAGPLTVWDVAILTTASERRLARGATEAGPFCQATSAWAEPPKPSIALKPILKPRPIRSAELLLIIAKNSRV